MRKILGIYALMFLIIWIASCKPVNVEEKQEDGVVNGMRTDVISKMQGSVCTQQEQLVEAELGSVRRVYDLLSEFKAVGFLKSSARCALRKDFNRNDVNNTGFSITLYDDCLENGSLWTFRSLSRQNNSVRAELVEYGGDPNKVTRLLASYEVKLRELQSIIGMKFYKCVSK